MTHCQRFETEISLGELGTQQLICMLKMNGSMVIDVVSAKVFVNEPEQAYMNVYPLLKRDEKIKQSIIDSYYEHMVEAMSKSEPEDWDNGPEAA